MLYIGPPASGVGNVDQASYQYVPKAWQDYFYNSLTPALRQRDSMAGVAPPMAAGWVSPATMQNQAVFANTFVVGGHLSTGLPIANNVYYLDHNGNGRYDSGETAWTDSSGPYQAGDALLAGKAPPIGTVGVAGVYYLDVNHNGQCDPGEALLQDPTQIHGVQNQLAYRDLDGWGQWTSDDPIWDDANGNGSYDIGETILYAASAPLQAGQWG